MNWKKIEDLAFSKNQVNTVRLQDKLGKQNIHENVKMYLNQLLIQ